MKMYKKPSTEATQVKPITIICASITGNNGGTMDLNGPGTGGGEEIGD